MRTMISPQRGVNRQQQHGVALIVALILLLTLSLIGAVAMQTSTKEERMSGHFRDRNLAFQAAEAALREAEQILLSQPPPLPMVIDRMPDPSDLTSYDWDEAEVFSGTLQGVFAPPRFFIERAREEGSVSVGPPTDDQGLYRVTARGQGGTEDAIVILQTLVRRPPF